MSLFLDLILIAVFVVTVGTAYSNGFFRSVMNLASSVVAVLVAYTATPALSGVIYDKFLHSSLSDALASTIASMARTGGDTAYDLTRLIDNSQFATIVEKYGANMDSITEFIETTADHSYESVCMVARTVAQPVATTLSTVIAFAAVFLIAYAVLLIFTAVIGNVFRLPVLRSMDKAMGAVFGVVSATVTVFVIAMLAEPCLASLSVVAPKIISPNLFENSILLKLFAEYNLLSMISNIMA